MASVSISAIRELRERTQAGMTDCKKALSEAEGNMDMAVEIILKKGQAKSAKRAGKVAAEGEVRADVFNDGRSAAIVEVNVETDFSARNDNFKKYVDRVAAAARDAAVGADLSAVVVDGKSLAEHASELTAIIGEKITIRRFDRLDVPEGTSGMCHSYVHMGGKIGVAIALSASNDKAASHEAVRSFADDTAMQIAAMNPAVLNREDIAQADVDKQREIFTAQLREEPKPKPEAVWPKIVEGKVDKWFAETVLLEQESVQHKKSIKELLTEAGKQAGGEVSIVRFVRYELGEGIERKTEDLAAGVAELLG